MLLRIPSLKLRVRGRKEAFEANLKTETGLWDLVIREMWAGRRMADQHKVLLHGHAMSCPSPKLVTLLDR
jgi:hypothetical protein